MSSTSVELDVQALFQNIGTQATKRYFLPRLGRVACFSRYKRQLRLLARILAWGGGGVKDSSEKLTKPCQDFPDYKDEWFCREGDRLRL
ncbi:conserved hypothetical protein [Microcystis aeruginosa PCC 9807]|uniref:Uncharacterized protein n=1 Tax=Microcystis aeruginosa PCC 9807 TaxID=1160283 RepID=I4H738_MICAE|nr:conserved hypothetical protein [Microcystis aeruginosa PCC 9807]